MNDEVLHSKTNNFLAIILNDKISFFRCIHREFLASQNAEYIDKLLQNFSPSEVLIKKIKMRKILVITIVLLDLKKDYI
jgi:DNA mismatch repair protein MutS